jgi:hypothetical protein
MAEVILPPRTRVAASTFKYIDATGSARAIYTGSLETTAFGGDRLGATLTFSPVGGLPATEKAKRARLLASLAGLRGKQNRIWMPDHSYTRRGAFPAAELHPDGQLRSASLWSASSGAALSSTDGALRVTLASATAGPGATLTTTVTPNVPYAVRAFLRSGRGSTQPKVSASDGTISSVGATFEGMSVIPIVPSASPLTFGIGGGASNGIQAGDYFECSYASVARCALVDGGPNLLLHSDTPGGTSWSLNNITASANLTAGPDGFTDAYYLDETTANASHNMSQAVAVPAAVADFTFSVYVKSVNRTWCYLEMQAGSTFAVSYFNASTGAVGASQSAGSDWANLRTASENCGNGWFRFSVTARKTTSATTIAVFVGSGTADGTSSFTGVVSPVALLTWRASLSASSFPTRAVQTIAAAVAAANDAAGYVYLKGLPPSTPGLLLAGDQVQIGKQLTFVVSSLDSNEAGIGYLEISPPLRYAPADNDPVMIVDPMGRFVFTGDFPTWANEPGVSTTADLDFEEDCRVS